MTKNMRSISLLVLITFVPVFSPIGPDVAVVSAEDDDRGFFSITKDIMVLLAAPVGVMTGASAVVGGTGVIASTGWSGVGAAAGGGAVLGGAGLASCSFDHGVKSAKNLINDIMGW